MAKNAFIEFEENILRVEDLMKSERFQEAIDLCIEKKRKEIFTDFKFQYTILLAELHLNIGCFERSVNFYLEAYNYVIDEQKTFRAFARSVDKNLFSFPEEMMKEFKNKLLNRIYNKDIQIAYQTAKLMSSEFPLGSFLSESGKKLINLLDSDNNFQYVVDCIKEFEQTRQRELVTILDIMILNRKRTNLTIRIDKYCVTVYERLELYYKAIKIASELINVDQDSVTIRSLFRLCRKMDNYEMVNKILLTDSSIERRNDFNILYELVYYYDKTNNAIAKKNALQKIESYTDSISILRTLKNLYLRFGTLEDVKRVDSILQEKIYKKSNKNKKQDAINDSEASVWSAIENSKRLEALANLTQGISHELGQPITNVRFMIQYYLGKKVEELDGDTIRDLFQTILLETERMGNLMNRLSPLTTTKNSNVKYSASDRIKTRVNAEKTRLMTNDINVDYILPNDVSMYGDPAMFDQIISNLLINSIHSLQISRRKSKKILIRVLEEGSKVRILFQDNGVGISPENRRKIFEPFFTTKPTGQGQGLGLFIIWNLLKYQGGSIYLDYDYTDGAMFIIELPKEAIRHE
ncbi:HAMP domain-containing histidine kinase [Tumebacillus sp. ITR2]|uniref:histidine kinase n=1 Tax=Tumebacillus amylolyticus TaxID=2801339 RepID=A0ABS1J9A7_9BACL|nr:HAMP domain-containing sensor histidine kinase [Tumebacillus amylolyticus]MBL0386866.1 HAMP domain-containing histidine kinase [Tumebacillus amylolyticus]